ncbi:hypothetical protein M6B38_269635 [Iris pallida]|uniref:Uncharacterized protein n=1 Tax=Iris pallida TaxID=29817 RepID=A0AAX6I7N5_IRIPA|nr:hypothetical protein M6B38_269630 [Iris pallida]KAJ6849242.1 hypothetical protein M6B38_269635 [Iris pallida]
MDSSPAPAAAPASNLIHKGKEVAKPDVPRPSRSGRRVLNPPPLSPSSPATAAAAANSAADKMKGLLIDKGKEKPSCRRRKVKEGAAKADVRRPPSARCQNRKALSDPSSKPKKPRVSTAVDISPEWFERCLRLEMEDGDDMGYVPFDYEKHEREEMEKAVAEKVQFVKDGIQRWIDRGFYGIRVRPRKPKEIASDDEYPSGSYSDMVDQMTEPKILNEMKQHFCK